MNRKCQKHQMQKRKSKDKFIIKSISDKQKVHTKFGIKICDQARFTSFKSEGFSLKVDSTW